MGEYIGEYWKFEDNSRILIVNVNGIPVVNNYQKNGLLF